QTNNWNFERNASNSPPRSLADVDLKRYVRAPVGTHTSMQDVTDATPVYYDRDDTTMCANGTFSHDWGAAAETTYELFNVEGGAQVDGGATADYDIVEDIDDALGASIDGAATTDQALKISHIATVLGSMIEDGHLYYNE